ncbi:MAG TPA: SDR family oxidoreductase [Polyangiaceae bacterium]|nr:SDR family oxidoreductase [Polyangiaceae bacterium]
MTTLQNKTALVTGVTSGIGAATARVLLEAGMRVIGVGRAPERLAATERELGPNFRPLLLDLADPESRRRGLAELGPEAIALLVNNAAECVYESALELPPARLSRLFEINVVGLMELTRGALANMPAGAQIINLSSVVARQLPAAKFAPYAASKAALDCLSEALRLELHPRIRVSSIAPGLVDTPIYDKVQGFERARSKLKEQVPTWLSAEDIASVVLWVATRPPHVVISELCVLPSAQAR